MKPYPLHVLRTTMILAAGVSAAIAWAASAEPAAPPVMSVSVRGLENGRAAPGDPLLVAVRVEVDSLAGMPAGPTLLLAPAEGTWVDAIAVELLDRAGRPTGARALPVGRPDAATATIGAERVAGGLWRFPAAATGRFTPGQYWVRARLAIEAGAGWTGTAASRMQPVELVAAATGPDRAAASALALAYDALLAGRNEEAAAELDRLLRREPGNLRAWTLRAVVCERVGNLLGANACLRQAQAAADQLALREPPTDLGTMQSRVLGKLGHAPPAAAEIPVWSWPTLPPEPVPTTPEQMARSAHRPPASAANPPPPPPVAAKAPPPAAARPPPKPVVLPGETDYPQDPRGQWAVTAEASSQYGPDRYSAMQATGAPNCPSPGDHPEAWIGKTIDGGAEWLLLHYAKPVHATEVRVRQSYNPGAIVKVEVLNDAGTATVVWSGPDKTAYRWNQVGWLVAKFPATAQPVNAVRLSLDTASVKGWNEIDAVQLVGDP
jgi:hypothetical protein